MNYGDQKSLVSSIINRRDVTATMITQAFSLAHALIQRSLRIPEMETKDTIDTSGGSVSTHAVPNTLLQLRTIVADGEVLQYVPYGNYVAMGTREGDPQYFTRVDGNFLFKPAIAQDAVAELVYYEKLTVMSADGDEPFLASLAPDLYIYGALSFLGDLVIDDRRSEWRAAFEALLANVQSDGDVEQSLMGTMQILPTYTLNDGV